MIALTESRKLELIEECKTVMDESSPDGDIYPIYAIALASLTAEPAYYVFKHPNGKLFHSLVDESCKGHNDVYPVFTAPPVPEIKLPDRDKLPGWARNHEDSLDWYESEIKRLNGLGDNS